ncbi:EAL domain-containing protein [Ideonella sp.]|uniref:bifunctional diguanylate cyclase/phosphodiesterase n=1 Tax=Ideonella sp. TaxID=1929293 RepID=UPI0035B26233
MIAAAVLLVGVLLSLAISQSARDEIRRNAQLRFDAASISASDEVERRFAAYVEVLAGLQALFHTGEVSREAFRRYAESLDLKRTFPGFQVLNYAPLVAAPAKDGFEAALQRDLGPDGGARFAIKPPGNRDAYQPISLIEPMAGNEAFLGKDIAVFPDVRAALEAARDSGRLTASGKLIQIQGEIGLAMRLPVYRPGQPIETAEQRREAYLGSVGAGFLVTRMLESLPAPTDGVRLRVFDGGREPAASPAADNAAPQADKLVFDTQRRRAQPMAAAASSALAAPAKAGAASEPLPTADTGFYRVASFPLGGRVWQIEASSPFDQGVGTLERLLPAIILVGGSIISLLLASVLLGLLGGRRRALALAFDMTHSLRSSEQRLAEAQALAKLGSWVLDTPTGAIECSDEARRIYGHDLGSAPLTLPRLLALVPDRQRAALSEAVRQAEHSDERVEIEHAVRLPDGGDRWVHVNLQRATEDGVAAVRATVRDETARKKAALRLELAHDIGQKLAVEAEPENAVAYILASIGTRLQWSAAVCWLREADGHLRCMHAWAQGDAPALGEFAAAMLRRRGALAGGQVEPASITGSPTWRSIPLDDSVHEEDRIASRCGLQAAVVIPVSAGAQWAALEFFSRAPISVDREIEGFMRSVASQLAQYLQRKQAEQALRHVAHHDALTGLANRPLLHDRLTHATQRAARLQNRVAVLFMDLDRFKYVNDSLGHSAGDMLLRACAERLRASVRESDTVARFGGDEFVVVLEGLQSSADAVQPLTKILARFNAPFEINGRELTTTASIGVSMFPDDGQDVETLLMHADAAMYRAKEKGAGSYEFHSDQVSSQGQQRLALESNLHRALEREELFLVYQPKLELATGRVTGVEALMRWQHPTLGMVSPAQFIPIAEDTGLIESMGQWALEVACRDALRWQQEGHPVQVSVNLSPRQLNRPRLVEEVSQILALAGLDAALLELEITESGVMRNPTRAAAQLRELRDLGVSLAIDDFGTGYSSLSYLQRFPLGTLKIDRSFIKDLPGDEDAAALTAGIIGLAQRLRMKVVAEGVETLEQLGFLRSHHCDQIQGYYLSKPITAGEMSRFLARDVRNLVSPVVAA